MRRAGATEAGLWLFATVALFHRVFLDGAVVVGRDALRLSIPLYDWWAQRVRLGEFPQWYPLDGFGQPFIGMLASAPFHPTHLLALFMPSAWAITLMVLGCIPVAACGATAFARRLGVTGRPALLAGATWGFSGALLSLHDNPGFLLGAATAPWALASLDTFLERGGPRLAAQGCGLLALCLYSGDAQTFLTVGLGTMLLAGWRRSWARGATAAGLTLLLAAPQLIPTWLAGQQTARAALGQAELERWSMHPLRLFELLGGPLFYAPLGSEAGKAISRTLLESGLSTLWANSLALAPAAVVLAGFAAWQRRGSREGRAMIAIAAVVFWLSLGKHLGASWVLAHLPVLRSFRYPEKWFLWFSFIVAVGAAHGLQLARPELVRRLFAIVAGLALGGLVTAAFWHGPYPEVAANALPAFGVSFVVLALAAMAARDRRLGWVVIAGAVLCAMPQSRILQLAPAQVLDTDRGFTRQIPLETPPPRVFRLMGKLHDAYDDPARLTSAFVDTLEPVARGVEAASNYLPGRTAYTDTLVESPPWLERRLFELGSVRFVSVSDPDLGKVLLPTVARQDAWAVSLLEDADAVPRAYLAQRICANTPSPLLLARPDFDRRKQVLMQCTGSAPAPEGTVVWKQYAPEHRVLEIVSDREATVVLVDAFADGWEARVDGQPAPIERANVAFQAVRVAAGTHALDLTYRTPGLPAGSASFGLGILLLGGWGWRRRRGDS